MDTFKEATWRIEPMQPPHVIRPCSNCGRRMAFYCSEKFRLNGNNHKIDIWLIYKCTKCDKTWKLTIKKGIKPHDLPTALFDQFIHNDTRLAWQYAFDQSLMKRNGAEMIFNNIEYTVDGYNDNDLASMEKPLRVRLESLYLFDLKLSVLLAKLLGVSVSRIKKLAEEKTITASLNNDMECLIAKHKIKLDVDVLIQPDWNR